jgi:hypothetical protein
MWALLGMDIIDQRMAILDLTDPHSNEFYDGWNQWLSH